MKTDGWRDRLQKAVEESGKSKRSISLQTGNGAGYLHSILTEGKDPGIENLMKVCDAIPVSLAFILYGYHISDEDAALINLMKQSPEAREAVLTLLRQSQSRD
ncbi:hypothetical protein [Ketogulonicigenium vulgare]|uniref:hypothetical protein n=1 Tax=Ketogulonicigenium vulgare TaxID=92945 RepID=UPI00235854A1|nr:hypothetical protein [Ketogulonicigenium vulgare]